MTGQNSHRESDDRRNKADLSRTFAHQDRLPRLPVPELDETSGRLREWVEPLVDEKQFQSTQKALEEFLGPGGEGIKLQRALKARAQLADIPNWLESFWEDNYLYSRKTLPINVNFSTVCQSHPAAAGMTQAQRAAFLILNSLSFKTLLDREELSVDLIQGRPVCMDQFRKMFSAVRIPFPEKDELRSPVSSFQPVSPNQRHIAVFHQGRIFCLDVIPESGLRPSLKALEESIGRILDQSTNSTAPEAPLGLLTAMNRDDWARARAELLEIHPQNRIFLDKLETALFVLCLDDTKPTTLEDRFRDILHGDGRNRWFDKSFQVIISGNGYVGMNGEHAGLDGYPVHRLIHFIHQQGDRVLGQPGQPLNTEPSHLAFHMNARLRGFIDRAAQEFDRLVDDTAALVLDFTDFGKNLIKSFKVSPDAFVQLALQLAQYGLSGRCDSTYEVTVTRRFLHGRTETLRSITAESVRFVKSMSSDMVNNRDKTAFFRAAAQKHVDRMMECMDGRGVHRHMFGLEKIYEFHGRDLGLKARPAIFSDPGWLTLCHDTFSTTSNPDPTGVVLSGFGPVVDDGYGICYTMTEDRMVITLTSRSGLKERLYLLAEGLMGSLRQMADLLKNQ